MHPWNHFQLCRLRGTCKGEPWWVARGPVKLELGSGKSGGSIASISAQGDQPLGASPVTWLLPDEKSRD